MGLFLTFLGAKELKPSSEQRRVAVDKMRAENENYILFEPLVARRPLDVDLLVNLTGNDLKGHNNVLKLRPPLYASIRWKSTRGPKKTVKVTFTDWTLPYDDDERQGIKSPDDHIGHHGLFTLDDFIDAPNRTFSSLHPNCGYIAIGRYGPFRRRGKSSECWQ